MRSLLGVGSTALCWKVQRSDLLVALRQVRVIAQKSSDCIALRKAEKGVELFTRDGLGQSARAD